MFSVDLLEEANNRYAEVIHSHRAKTADSYESFLSFFKTYILPRLPADKGVKILDVGCGAGHLLWALRKNGYINCFGIDSSEQQIRQAKKWVSCVEKADLWGFLSPCKGEFHVIVLVDVVEHLGKNSLFHLLKQLHTSLRPGGIVIVHTTNGWSPFSRFYFLSDLTHQQLYSPKMLGDIARLANFEECHWYPSEPEHIRRPESLTSLRSLLFLFLRAARCVLWRMVSRAYAIAEYIAIGTSSGVYTPNFIIVCRKGSNM